MRKISNPALLILNIQVDFCSSDGFAAKLGRNIKPIQKLLPCLKSFYRRFRQLSIPIFFGQYVSRKDFSPKNIRINKDREEKARMCLFDSRGAAFYYLKPQEPDLVIRHCYYDAFVQTSLLNTLRRKQTKTLIIAGVRSELSIDATAKRAINEGFEVIIVRDLVSTYQEHLLFQKQSLQIFDRYYGYVRSSQSILDQLQD